MVTGAPHRNVNTPTNKTFHISYLAFKEFKMFVLNILRKFKLYLLHITISRLQKHNSNDQHQIITLTT